MEWKLVKNHWTNNPEILERLDERVHLKGERSTEESASPNAPEIKDIRRKIDLADYDTAERNYLLYLIGDEIYGVTIHSFCKVVEKHMDRDEPGVTRFKEVYWFDPPREPVLEDFLRPTWPFTTDVRDSLGYREWLSEEIYDREMTDNGRCNIYQDDRLVYAFEEC